MSKLILDIGELRALHDLLAGMAGEQDPFQLSPKRRAYRSVLEKIRDMLEEESPRRM